MVDWGNILIGLLRLIAVGIIAVLAYIFFVFLLIVHLILGIFRK